MIGLLLQNPVDEPARDFEERHGHSQRDQREESRFGCEMSPRFFFEILFADDAEGRTRLAAATGKFAQGTSVEMAIDLRETPAFARGADRVAAVPGLDDFWRWLHVRLSVGCGDVRLWIQKFDASPRSYCNARATGCERV